MNKSQDSEADGDQPGSPSQSTGENQLPEWIVECLSRLFSSISDPTRIRITERWHSIEALAAHFQTPHMAAFQQVMAANPPKNVTAHCYDAE